MFGLPESALPPAAGQPPPILPWANASTDAALRELVVAVNGFPYSGRRLEAILASLTVLRRRPELCVALGLAPAEAPKPSCPLTERQLACIALAAQGMIIGKIGAKLFISASTVKTHIHNAANVVGAKNTTELVAIAMRSGWIA